MGACEIEYKTCKLKAKSAKKEGFCEGLTKKGMGEEDDADEGIVIGQEGLGCMWHKNKEGNMVC